MLHFNGFITMTHLAQFSIARTYLNDIQHSVHHTVHIDCLLDSGNGNIIFFPSGTAFVFEDSKTKLFQHNKVIKLI